MKFHDDTNSLIAALLRDLAAVQPLQRSGWGYKRAANAVLALDVPIESLVQADGSLGSRSRVVAALNDPSLVGPTLADYHGDLQMHSVWSDGSQTLEQIIETGLARGYDYCGVTDHSYGLPIAGGLSMAELAEQQREVDRLNRTYRDHFMSHQRN